MNDGPPGGSSMPGGMPPYFTVGNLAQAIFMVTFIFLYICQDIIFHLWFLTEIYQPYHRLNEISPNLYKIITLPEVFWKLW